MRLDNHSDTTSNGASQNSGQDDLSRRVKVNFRLLQINRLFCFSDMQSHDHGENLRNSKTNVGDIYEVMCSAANGGLQPSNQQLRFRIAHPLGRDLPGESQVMQIGADFV